VYKIVGDMRLKAEAIEQRLLHHSPPIIAEPPAPRRRESARHTAIKEFFNKIDVKRT
jgi:hypothetical protein